MRARERGGGAQLLIWFSRGAGVEVSHLLFIDDTLVFC